MPELKWCNYLAHLGPDARMIAQRERNVALETPAIFASYFHVLNRGNPPATARPISETSDSGIKMPVPFSSAYFRTAAASAKAHGAVPRESDGKPRAFASCCSKDECPLFTHPLFTHTTNNSGWSLIPGGAVYPYNLNDFAVTNEILWTTNIANNLTNNY